jgi:hypothetical protein
VWLRAGVDEKPNVFKHMNYAPGRLTSYAAQFLSGPRTRSGCDSATAERYHDLILASLDGPPTWRAGRREVAGWRPLR